MAATREDPIDAPPAQIPKSPTTCLGRWEAEPPSPWTVEGVETAESTLSTEAADVETVPVASVVGHAVNVNSLFHIIE